MLKVKEIAEQFGVSQHTVGVWIASGELAAFNVARKQGSKPIWRISPEALEAFQELRSASPPPTKAKSRRRQESDVIQFYS